MEGRAEQILHAQPAMLQAAAHRNLLWMTKVLGQPIQIAFTTSMATEAREGEEQGEEKEEERVKDN